MTKKLDQLKQLISEAIEQQQYGNHPEELYEPIRYLMALGGKRLRPLLTLLGYTLFQNDPEKIVKQALAVEVFHNFTLMHDDIMDEAPLRRGKPTVHEKWDRNTAILSGDVMLVKAYEILIDVERKYLPKVLRLFNKCAAEVCEGQQMDMAFESKDFVGQKEYLEMIRLKTAVLLGMSLRLGALLAGASKSEQKALYRFGVNIGIGFQLMDDLLDVYADKQKFGKQVGGDIIANKKTFLLIKALETSDGELKTELQQWLGKKKFDPEEKVTAVTDIYNRLNIKELTTKQMDLHFQEGFKSLAKMKVGPSRKAMLRQFTETLIARES
ncbi:polyprenyl synthetase family protein [Fulvivirga sp. M361]|uniref:polyprenyl synthetase family protein n=1 Tax=Fulvivirga sp. M361 TaxID=2594266 RepID=UPI00117A1157|nr:polyprenyl synthetase family protein [Fulvivirga sp. M361]TRX58690.1 polyprenyl synthetase family protein [Fulvivirga sp. M361]